MKENIANMLLLYTIHFIELNMIIKLLRRAIINKLNLNFNFMVSRNSTRKIFRLKTFRFKLFIKFAIICWLLLNRLLYAHLNSPSRRDLFSFVNPYWYSVAVIIIICVPCSMFHGDKILQPPNQTMNECFIDFSIINVYWLRWLRFTFHCSFNICNT